MATISIFPNFKIDCSINNEDPSNPEIIICCPHCGKPFNFENFKHPIIAAETGYFYCSSECAKEDVNKNYNKEGGYLWY